MIKEYIINNFAQETLMVAAQLILFLIVAIFTIIMRVYYFSKYLEEGKRKKLIFKITNFFTLFSVVMLLMAFTPIMNTEIKEVFAKASLFVFIYIFIDQFMNDKFLYIEKIEYFFKSRRN